jgi:hypothetical protein
MEDLIPLVIVIAISIFGAITNKNKKRQPQEDIGHTRPVQEKKDDFLSWIERIAQEDDLVAPFIKAANGPTVQEKTFQEEIEQQKAAKPEPDKYASYSGFISPEETEALKQKEGARVIKTKSFDEGDLTKQNFFKDEEVKAKEKIDFDGRKAVIYSEILNRKYAR